MPETETGLRSRPRQARSHETFDRILRAAAELLEDVGWDGFNTNILAERSGHRVAAIYRYFPNKIAIVTALAEQLVADWDDWLAGFNRRLEESGDIKETWAYFVRRFPEVLKTKPAGIAVRRAMQSSPVLREIDQKDNAMLASYLAISLANAMPHLEKKRAQTAARILLESAVSVIDLSLEAKPADARRLLDELLAMHDAYLDQLNLRKGRV